MDIDEIIIRKVLDILFWNYPSSRRDIFTIDYKDGNVTALRRSNGEGFESIVCIINNKCGSDGLHESFNIIESLDYVHVNSFIFLTKNRGEIKKVERKLSGFMKGYVEAYGVNPDYFFSIVPLSGTGRRVVERYIFSMMGVGVGTLTSKIKFLLKQILIFFKFSEVLYDHHILIVYK